MRLIMAAGLAALGTIAAQHPSLAQFSPGYSPPVMPSWYDYGILRQQTINGANNGNGADNGTDGEELIQEYEEYEPQPENPFATESSASPGPSLPSTAIPLLQQQGALQAGDSVIPIDGSFYDQYTFTGQAGQTVTLWMQSSEFDTYLAVVDANGQVLAENDDLNSSTTNSAITLTLAEDGIYTIIANTSAGGETGQYVVGAAAW